MNSATDERRGAGPAVVTKKDVPPMSVAAGVPAKVIRQVEN
ncbi:hypothetical protein [Parenemella sanctibonifatiensis]|nr:hypothetical protein [Parenemella sanctibonifatiensis]